MTFFEIYFFRMTKVWVKLYEPFTLAGGDFGQIRGENLRRITFSPDEIHSISIVTLRDGALLFTNEASVAFDFSISRNHRVIAVVKYREHSSSIVINNNWWIHEDRLENRAISTNPELVHSQHVNIELLDSGIGRADFKVQNSPFAAGFFTDRDLLFMRVNGNHAHPRLLGAIEQEALNKALNARQVNGYIQSSPDFVPESLTEGQLTRYLERNPGIVKRLTERLWKTGFQNWIRNNNWFGK